MAESSGGTKPERSIRCFQSRVDVVIYKPLGDGVIGKFPQFKTTQAAHGAKPQATFPILKNCPNTAIRQPLLNSKRREIDTIIATGTAVSPKPDVALAILIQAINRVPRQPHAGSVGRKAIHLRNCHLRRQEPNHKRTDEQKSSPTHKE